MRPYELMYIVRPDIEEEKLTQVIEKFSNLIVKEGGEVTKTDKWGKRKLAYVINDKWSEGFYTLVHFNGQPEVVNELDRVMKLTEDVVRHMITRIEE
ncbi:SSU ribosomal protein S6P [Desulfonispora thiosulfatigenes DSM 11270]|uniref:Small ribosomal subunit protein bS6 n=1 Tax=Desulfonispora thiosulfatigenes DSM 11270 TaxID=656914 RepID=A0A1W1V309_DESTI|nr:30S ribosomal protein S6 [Desulfonispora thiosulfatigenes]SMB87688.1 SSU ribosomal protein S6P [Desulfonispora thiosulfatigenes DSM 11270]